MLDEKAIRAAFEGNKKEAEKIIRDADETERLLERVEEKLKLIPLVGDVLSDVPTLIALVRSYVKKEYTDVPIGTIIAIVAALLYFLSPVDLIPDIAPAGVGYLDDAAVVSIAYKLVHSDVDEYRKWRKARA